MKKYFTLILVLLTFMLNNSIAQTVSLYAGTPQTSGQDVEHEHRLSAKFNQPFGLDFDSKGNLWISDKGNHTIRMITAIDTVYWRAGAYLQPGFRDASSTNSRFHNPSGIAVGTNDEIYVADWDNHVIRKLSPFTALWNAQIISIFAGLATNKTSQLYTSHPGFENGDVLTEAQFDHPIDVTVDPVTGDVYVADQYNHAIRKISDGIVSTVAGNGTAGHQDGTLTQARFDNPMSVYYYNGKIYVSERGLSRYVREIDIAGNNVSTIFEYGVDPLFNNNGIFIDQQGSFYICDHHRVLKSTNDTLSVYVGSIDLMTYGYSNGIGTDALFNNVKMSVKSSTGQLYITDMDNHVIREVTICQTYAPAIDTSGSTKFCESGDVTLTVHDTYNSYKWSTGATTKSITVNSTETITVTVIDAQTCPGTSDPIYTQLVIPNPPIQTVPSPPKACLGDSVLVSGQGNYDTWLWSSGESVQSIYVKQTSTLTLTVTIFGCQGTSDPITITIADPSPTLNHSDTSFCEGDTVILKTTESFTSYTWSDGKTSSNIPVIYDANNETRNFYVEVIDNNGCEGRSNTIEIINYANPDKPSIGGEWNGLHSTVNGESFQWYRNGVAIPGATDMIYDITQDGGYQVEVFKHGCSSISDTFYYYYSSIGEFIDGSKIEIYPNPNHGKFTIKVILKNNNNAGISISNALGEVIAERKVDNSGSFEEELDLSNFGKGIYFVTFKIGEIQKVFRIIVK